MRFLFLCIVAVQSAKQEALGSLKSSIQLSDTCPSSTTKVSKNSEYIGCTVSGLSNDASGGVFTSSTNVIIKIQDSYFSKCYSSSGSGGVCYSLKATYEIDNCTFVECSARSVQSKGGILYQTETAKLTMTNSKVDMCYSGANGGVIQVYGGDAVIKDNCVFSRSYANANSGGVVCEVSQGSIIEITGCTILHCESKGNSAGGCLFVNYANWSICDCILENCTSVKGGGAIYQWNGVSLIVDNCIFTTCVATCTNSQFQSGGGIALEGGVTSITNCAFSGCYSYNNGGAIGTVYRSGNDFVATVAISNCKMTECRASLYGGALFVNKSTWSVAIDTLICSDCYGTEGREGLSVYILSIETLTWRNLCISGTGSLFYSVINQPLEADLERCPETENIHVERYESKICTYLSACVFAYCYYY